MVLHQLPEKAVVLILQQIIIPDARANKHLFNSLYGTDGAQNIQILALIRLQLLAGLGGKALFALTQALSLLQIAGRPAEVAVGPPISWM